MEPAANDDPYVKANEITYRAGLALFDFYRLDRQVDKYQLDDDTKRELETLRELVENAQMSLFDVSNRLLELAIDRQ
jgi:hypothetical protein